MPLPLDHAPSDLCVLRLSAIGDTCHAVPVVRALQAAWPSARVTWIVGGTEHALLRGLEGVEFVVLDKDRGLSGYAAVRRALAGRHFDVLLNMHASLRANVVSTLVRTPIKLGFDRARARDYQWLFSTERLAARPRRHVMDGLFEFAETLGVPRGTPRWDLPVEPSDVAFAERVLAGGGPTLVISPCTGERFRNYRNWRVESYAEVADHAAARYGMRVLLTGGSSEIERQYGLGIAGRSKSRPQNLIGQTSLKQLLAILQRSSVVLCPDSGPAHMATAVGTPVVGLYATSNRHRTGPYFSQHLVVDKYSEAVAREFGRPIDALRWGQRVRDPQAMDLITVPDVVGKLELALAERGVEPVR